MSAVVVMVAEDVTVDLPTEEQIIYPICLLVLTAVLILAEYGTPGVIHFSQRTVNGGLFGHLTQERHS
jgi:hypothetical protein